MTYRNCNNLLASLLACAVAFGCAVVHPAPHPAPHPASPSPIPRSLAARAEAVVAPRQVPVKLSWDSPPTSGDYPPAVAYQLLALPSGETNTVTAGQSFTWKAPLGQPQQLRVRAQAAGGAWGPWSVSAAWPRPAATGMVFQVPAGQRLWARATVSGGQWVEETNHAPRLAGTARFFGVGTNGPERPAAWTLSR